MSVISDAHALPCTASQSHLLSYTTADLQQIYGELVATAIHTVNLENIATFLDQKPDPQYRGEVGSNYN